MTIDDLAFYDEKPCSDCDHLGAEHNVDGECFLCECEAYHWHEGCELQDIELRAARRVSR